MQLSVSGRKWVLMPSDLIQVRRLVHSQGVTPLIATCLAGMIGDSDPADWLEPSYSQLHDPFLMEGMHAAVARIEKAIRDRQRIRIVTDYDVDGTTSSLILQAMCRLLGADNCIDYHIPNRFTEGYGFSPQAAEQAARDGIGLIVTADIGIRDQKSVERARNGGVDVVICDHHIPPGEMIESSASAVLCPPQAHCRYPNPHLAACGVSLKLAQAMLTKSGRFRNQPQQLQRIIRSMMKVAAIGTVADVVSLASMENRAIVALGLQDLRKPLQNHSYGLQALLECAGVRDGFINAGTIGFQIAPRINAAGRLKKATDVIDLFQATDLASARVMAQQLDKLNVDRRKIERDLVMRCRMNLPDPIPHFIVMSGTEQEGWHRGVVGIVASRLRDLTHRSTAIVSICGDRARGSVRTTPQVHAVNALASAQHLLSNYGGHAAAAGFDVDVSNIEPLAKQLDQFVAERLSDTELIPELALRAQCSPRDISMSFAHELYKLGPFGKGNPVPLFWVRNVRPQKVQLLKDRHVKFWIDGKAALWWNASEHIDKLKSAKTIDVAARLEINRYNQRSSVQYTVEDVLLPPSFV